MSTNGGMERRFKQEAHRSVNVYRVLFAFPKETKCTYTIVKYFITPTCFGTAVPSLRSSDTKF
jgi:hypothetical protein